jgi:hypothetical protein
VTDPHVAGPSPSGVPTGDRVASPGDQRGPLVAVPGAVARTQADPG